MGAKPAKTKCVRCGREFNITSLDKEYACPDCGNGDEDKE